MDVVTARINETEERISAIEDKRWRIKKLRKR